MRAPSTSKMSIVTPSEGTRAINAVQIHALYPMMAAGVPDEASDSLAGGADEASDSLVGGADGASDVLEGLDARTLEGEAAPEHSCSLANAEARAIAVDVACEEYGGGLDLCIFKDADSSFAKVLCLMMPQPMSPQMS